MTSVDKKITWDSPFPIAPHRGEKLLNVLIKDKSFLSWCYKKELHLQYQEIEWLFSQLKPQERKVICKDG